MEELIRRVAGRAFTETEIPGTVAAHARWSRFGDRAVVLCLETGQYFGFGAVATAIWEALERQDSPGETCAQVAAEFQVPVDVVEGDYAEFVTNLTRQGLLVDVPTEPRLGRKTHGPRWVASPRFRAWRNLLVIAWKLRTRGFASTYRYASNWSQTSADLPERGRVVDRALCAFRSAESFFISGRGADDCLSRSLSLFVFLRQMGVPARHRIGVAGAPFAAHAWVDLDDDAVLEDRDRLSRFTVIASLP